MILSHRLRLFLLTFFALLFSSGMAMADDDGWLDFEEPVAQANQRNHFIMGPEQFEQWVFQQQGSREEQLKSLHAELALMIAELEQSSDLTLQQKRKLELAGERDLRDFFDDFEALAAKYAGMSQMDQRFNNVWQEIQPLQTRLSAGLFRAESMFAKVVNNTLTPEQNEVRNRAEAKRRAFRYRAMVQLFLMAMDRQILLSATERDELQTLILKETKPPNLFGQHNNLYLSYQVSQISKMKLSAISPGPRGKAITKVFQQGRGYKRHLENQGVRPFEESGEEKTAAEEDRKRIKRPNKR